MNTDPIPEFLKLILSDFPGIVSVSWDGEIKVNGVVTGPPEVFEPLWDFFVDSPHAAFVVDDGNVVRIR